MTEQELLRSGIGRKIVFLGRAANMISVSLSSTEKCQYEFAIHISTKGIIILDGNLITNTEDINEYVGPGVTKYEEKVKELFSSEKDFRLQSIYYDSRNCVHAMFSNALEVHSLYEPFESQTEGELWRVFLNWKAAPHLIATQQGVFLESYNDSQEELDKMRAYLKARREKIISRRSQ